MKRLWFIAPVLAMALGCGESETSTTPVASPPPFSLPTAEQASLIPMQAGNQWVYTVESAEQQDGQAPQADKGEMIWRITKVTEDKNGPIATCEMSVGGKVVDRQQWRRTEGGFFQLDGLLGAAKYSSPQPIIAFPVKQGSRLTWEGTGPTPNGQIGKIKYTTEVLGPEGVDTESDRVNGIAFHSITEFTVKGTPGRCETVSWFKPGAGLVRYRSAVAFGKTVNSILLRLKSSTVKQP